ncbi:MAG: hypothetical protein Q9162_002967 [Coniocarpon cinnabarinum]
MAPRFNPVFGDIAGSGTLSGLAKGSQSPPSDYKFEQDTVFHRRTNGVFLDSNADSGFHGLHGESPEAQDPATIPPENAPKIDRRPGGRPVTIKRFRDELDEEDLIIKQMKEAGYTDHQIVQELKGQGLTSYNPKSVATRYSRILRITRDKENERLDDELSDWHEGDNNMLKTAMAYHVDKYNRDIERAKELFYQSVADTLHGEQSRAGHKIAFSKTELRKHHEALEDGTALPELELDPDQESRQAIRRQRRVEIDRNIALREEERKKKEAERQAAEDAQTAKLQAEKDRRAQHAHTLKIREEGNLSWKAQAKTLAHYLHLQSDLKGKRPDAAERKKAVKQDIMDAIAKGDMERHRRDEEDAAFRAREDEREMDARAKAERKEEAAAKAAKQTQRAKKNIKNIICDDLKHMFFLDKIPDIDSDACEEIAPGKERKFKNARMREEVESDNEVLREIFNPHRFTNSSKEAEKKPYALSFPLNPRSRLSLTSIRTLAQIRGMPATGDKKLMVYKLARADEDLTIIDLRKKARSRGIAPEGTKVQLLTRIALDDAGQLVGGSTYYMEKLHPKRHTLTTFASLSIDDEGTHSKGRFAKSVIAESSTSSSDEKGEPGAIQLE